MSKISVKPRVGFYYIWFHTCCIFNLALWFHVNNKMYFLISYSWILMASFIAYLPLSISSYLLLSLSLSGPMQLSKYLQTPYSLPMKVRCGVYSVNSKFYCLPCIATRVQYEFIFDHLMIRPALHFEAMLLQADILTYHVNVDSYGCKYYSFDSMT